MSKSTLIKSVLAILFLIATVVFITVDNEIIFPSTMVGFFLMLLLLGKENSETTLTGKASRLAIVIFSAMVIILNITVSMFLPGIAAGIDFSHHAVELTTSLATTDPNAVREHFVQVNINDMHELCYTTSLLLIIYLISYGIIGIKNRRTAAA